MSLWEAAVLGLIQGLTEFLPVSSSGHLALGQALLGIETGDLTFEVIVHAGTLLAVLVALRGRIADLVAGCVRREPRAWKTVGWVALGTMPAGVVGLLFEDAVESTFASVGAVGGFLLLTGAVLWSTRRRSGTREAAGGRDAVGIGIAQALAILPGISRSGITIAAGVHLGLKATEAAVFSFLLSIPVILGATVLKVGDLLASPPAGEALGSLLVGFAVAFLSGLAAIRWLLALLARGRLDRFAWYCWAVGLLAVGWYWA